MRLTRALAAVLSAAAVMLVGCGSDAKDRAQASARFLDEGSDAVVSVSLDYEGSDWTAVKRIYARAAGSGAFGRLAEGVAVPPTLDGAFNALAQFAGLSFQDDVKPLLGGTLLVGVSVTPAPPLPPDVRDILERFDESRTKFEEDQVRYFDRDGRPLPAADVERARDVQSSRPPTQEAVATYRAPDADALAALIKKLEKLGLRPRPLDGVKDARRLQEGVAVVAEDTLVVVLDAGDREPDDVLRERLEAPQDGPAQPEAEDALVAVRVAPSALGTVLDEQQLSRALTSAPVGRALRAFTARLDVEDKAVSTTGRVDFEGLGEADLPLGPPAPLELPTGEGIASASADQQRTTVFLAQLVRELYPESRFVREVTAFEQAENLRFEDEVLRAFSGPSVSIFRTPNGDEEFAARSSLRDPERMRALLPRLAPALPDILQGLQGLGDFGLSALLFVAPDAPLTPSAMSILPALRARPLDRDLYEITGIDPTGNEAFKDTLVYGMIGDAFVVGSTRALAEEVATVPTEKADPAATRMRIDVQRLVEQSEGDTSPIFAKLVSAIDAEASGENGDIVFSARATLP